MIRTAGTWDRGDWPTYFIASNVKHLSYSAGLHDHLLIAINELENEATVDQVRKMLDEGNKVLVDSGVFGLATKHAAKHGISMDEALNMAPDKVDGFHHLFARYTEIIASLGARPWGYIEIDQGGRENKIKTRARLEAMGLRPIPVYHPFNDGWDYFDYLAERYDRICFGNVVQADTATRKRLVATAWERRRKYPDLWIHMLGLTPSEITAAYPINSCDSSTWLSGVRWGSHDALICNKRGWATGGGLRYRYGADPESPEGWLTATRLAAYESALVRRQMHVMANDQRSVLGVDIGLFDEAAQHGR